MRTICEIIADIKDGKEVPYEELKMACLVQSSMLFFFRTNAKTLLKGGIAKKLLIQSEYSDPETSSKEMAIETVKSGGLKQGKLIKEWTPSEEPPVSGEYVLLSFENFSIPLVGRYEEDEDGGGTYYMGDEEESCISQDIIVNAWMSLPKPYHEP